MREHTAAGGLKQATGTVPDRELLSPRVKLPGGPASYCLTCGPYRLVAPKARAVHARHLFVQGDALARVLGRAHPRGERVLLFHTIEAINHALQLQRHLPGLRLSLSSNCRWAEYRRLPTAPGWTSYVLLTSRKVPEYVDDLAHSAPIWKTLGDRRTEVGTAGQGVHLQLVLWRLGAGAGPPPSHRFWCDYLPRVMGAPPTGP